MSKKFYLQASLSEFALSGSVGLVKEIREKFAGAAFADGLVGALCCPNFRLELDNVHPVTEAPALIEFLMADGRVDRIRIDAGLLDLWGGMEIGKEEVKYLKKLDIRSSDSAEKWLNHVFVMAKAQDERRGIETRTQISELEKDRDDLKTKVAELKAQRNQLTRSLRSISRIVNRPKVATA